MTFTGGTGIDTSGSGNAVTFAIDSTVATLTGTQTLTNKTLTTPTISGNLTTDGTIDGRDVATDGAKLDGIEAGATADQTAAEIRTLVGSASDSNVFTDADHSKLDGIEAGATGDQTNAEIRAAVEAATDSNVFTDADHSKLDGIEASADVTDTANVTAAGALMDSELTSEASVKALNQGVATTDSPTFAAVTVNGNVEFDGLSGTGSVTVTDILDQDDMSSNSATALATQQSIKAYVDSQVATVDTLAEVLGNGNTTGGTDIQFSAGDNITNASGDFTIDIAGDITLDAGGGDFIFSDDATEIGRLKNVAAGFQLQSSVSNKDLVFAGSDAGVDITALTLDMSAAGAATFNSSITTTDVNITSNTPVIRFTESDQSDKQYQLGSFGSAFAIYDSNNSQYRYVLDTNGNHVFNEGSTDSDFRVESNGNTHMLFVDAGNDRIGIGTSSPSNYVCTRL